MQDSTTSDRTYGELDRAVIAYRENPTEENSARLLRAQKSHADSFQREQIAEFIRRTQSVSASSARRSANPANH